DARAVAPGSGNLEEGHPRDRARAQQFLGADLVTGALGTARDRARSRAAAAHLPHDRGPREASAWLHRWLRALREAPATEARAGRVGRVPARLAEHDSLHARE